MYVHEHTTVLIWRVNRLEHAMQAMHNKCTKYSGTSLLKTLWDFDFSPYYRGFLNSEVIQYTTVLHWDTEWCPYYRGFCNSEICNREVPLYTYVRYVHIRTMYKCTRAYHVRMHTHICICTVYNYVHVICVTMYRTCTSTSMH